MGKEKTKELVLKLLACMDKNRGLSTQEITSLVNLIAQETKKAEVRGEIYGQFYYLHRIKEAIATGQDVYKRIIDELEAETRKKKRKSILQESEGEG